MLILQRYSYQYIYFVGHTEERGSQDLIHCLRMSVSNRSLGVLIGYLKKQQQMFSIMKRFWNYCQKYKQQQTIKPNTNNTTYFKPSESTVNIFGQTVFKQPFPQLLKDNASNIYNQITKIALFAKLKVTSHNLHPTILESMLPVQYPLFSKNKHKIYLTWFGHSTCLLTIGTQANILIDPIFSNRCSPFSWIGPSRYRPIPCSISELPRIDIVCISHDHYDHMDLHSIIQLQKYHDPIFVAGLKSKQIFTKQCRLLELDWTKTQTVKVNGNVFQITFVPVCHWAKRQLFGKNTHLWGGFVIQTPNKHKIFYSGDTGYCQIFKDLYRIFGQFDLCVLPIGTFQPKQLYGSSHLSPSQAVKVHKQLHSAKTIGVHWGTFPLGFQTPLKQKGQFQQSKQRQGLANNEFVIMRHGQQLWIPYQ